MKKLFFFIITLFWSGEPFLQDKLPLETVLQAGHKDQIRCYDFSADGQFLITGGFDNNLILWNLNSGKQIRIFNGHTSRLRDVSFNRSGSQILSLSADDRVKIHQVETGELLFDEGVEGQELYQVFYGPNEKYIYALNNRDGVYVWELNTQKLIGQFKKEYAAHYESNLISPDGTKILSLNSYKGSLVQDIHSGDTVLSIPFDKVYSQSYSADGKYIAISSRKLFASIFDAETGEKLHDLRDGDARCDGCNTHHQFSPDSKYIVTMSNKVPVILWDVNTGKKIRSFKQLEERPVQLEFSKNGTYLLVAVDEMVFVFETKSGKELMAVKSEYIDYFDFKFSDNERFIAMPNEFGGIEIWDVRVGKKIKLIEGFLNREEDNRLALSRSNWFDQSILNYIQHKRKVSFHPTEPAYIIGGVDTCAMLIEMNTGRVLNTFTGHKKGVIAFAFSKDGKWLATAGGDRKILIWDLTDYSLVQTLTGHRETIFDLSFTNDGSQLISGAWDGTFRIWDWRSNEFVMFDFGNNSPYTVGFTPDELYVVATDLTERISFWEKDAVSIFRSLVGHKNIVSNFDFDKEGKHIATASWDGTVKVWDVLTGMLVKKQNYHNGSVYSVKFQFEKDWIISAGADNTIIIWDWKGNKVVKELKGHASEITHLELNKAQTKMASISIDGMVKIWDLQKLELDYSRVQLNRNEWIATSPNGHFDGSSKALGSVNYVEGNQVINIESLFEKYYTPGLIKMISEGKLNQIERSSIELKSIPSVPKIDFIYSTKSRNIISSDTVLLASDKSFQVNIAIQEHDIPLQQIRIYNNDKLVLQESLEEGISFRGVGGRELQFNIPLSPGVNEVKAYVINKDRVESAPTKLLVKCTDKANLPNLFVLAVGINDYKNPTYNLNYAVPDAKAFIKSIEQGADSLFEGVFISRILDKEATKPQILAAIKKMKTEIRSTDVFLMYYAGHGVLAKNNSTNEDEFFIVTHDLTNLYADYERLSATAISATELLDFSMNIGAEKQLFILDACHSGGALNTIASRGSEREKALAQLARSTGTFFLTAAQDAEFANEVGKLNHGLFTYALLEVLEGTVNPGSDKQITVNELKSYAEERVPELTETYQGSPQYPTGYSFGRDFPIVILK